MSRIISFIVVAMVTLLDVEAAPFPKPVKNNISEVALKLLGMLDGPCQMYDYQDTVKRPGCEPVQIVNKFCGGKCISRYYPGFAYCTSCMPRRIVRKKVFFKCPSDPVKKIRHRKINFVQDCECKRFLCKK